MDIAQLDKTFGRGDRVRVVAGNGGLACVRVSNAAADAEIYLQGAHVTKFHPKGQHPVVWMSGASLFQAGKAIRGGIPICWPWFGPNDVEPAFPAHGFARSTLWTIVGTDTSTASTTITLRLTSPAPNPQHLPAPFTLTCTIDVGASLRVSLAYENASDQAQIITEALHTYLTVRDVHDVAITGLAGTTYVDKVQQTRATEGDAPIVIRAETDRVYLGTQGPVIVKDPGLARTLRVSKSGSASTVIWNPWSEKAKKMADFGDDEWPGMVCIEAANAHDDRVTVAGGTVHTIATEIAVTPD